MGSLQIITIVVLIVVGIGLYKLYPRIPESKRNAVAWAFGIVATLATILAFLVPVAQTPKSSTPPPLRSTPTPMEAEDWPTPPALSDLIEERRDDFSSDSSGWNIIKLDPNGTAQYEDREYSIDVEGRKLFVSLWPGAGEIDSRTFALAVTALGPWGDQGANEQGIVVGWEQDFNKTVYAFTLSSSGICRFRFRQLTETESGEENAIWRVESGISVFGQETTEAPHDLLLVKKDNSLIGYVDGQFCGQYEMDDYEAGFIGLAALGPDAGGKSYFDDFVIYRFR